MKMLKSNFFSIKIIAIALFFIIVSSFIQPALATDSIYSKTSIGLEASRTEIYGPEGQLPLELRLLGIVNFLLTFVAIIFFILLIYAGYTWMMARGNDEEVTRAKKIIRQVVTALIIILLARVFTEFLINSFTDSVTNVGQE